jgi:5-methylcytosine-specific restriction endonuclease McrA
VIHDVLKLDAGGVPDGWITPRDAAIYYAKDDVLWTLGEPFSVLHGGFNRARNAISEIALHPIIATRGSKAASIFHARTPALNRDKLYQRDRHICAYCGQRFATKDLSCDHVLPVSRGGRTSWENCVTACRRDNQKKSNYLLSECGMKLLYLPYRPSPSEDIILSAGGKRIIADVMEFLQASLPASSRLIA